MAHRPDSHELEDVVKTELQARAWVPQADPSAAEPALQGNAEREAAKPVERREIEREPVVVSSPSTPL